MVFLYVFFFLLEQFASLGIKASFIFKGLHLRLAPCKPFFLLTQPLFTCIPTSVAVKKARVLLENAKI